MVKLLREQRSTYITCILHKLNFTLCNVFKWPRARAVADK